MIDKLWLTPEDISDLLKIKPSTIKLLIKAGRGPESYKFGSHIRVKKEDFDSWVAMNSVSKLKKITETVLQRDIDIEASQKQHPTSKP
jgi:excisionase family DNA binding protein